MLDNDCDGRINNGCTMDKPEKPKPRDPCDEFGDPVSLSGANSQADYTDLTVNSTLGPFSITRTFVSRDDIWGFHDMLSGVPRPFGSSRTNADSMQWWHNLYTFVHVDEPRWDVRDMRGVLTSYWGCEGVLPCWASNPDASRSVRERLQRTSSGFKFYHDDGTVLVYEVPWSPPGSSTATHHFLSSIVNRRGVTLANLTYATPSGCPTGGPGSAAGAPYIQNVLLPESQLVFTYKLLDNLYSGQECVVDQLLVGPVGGPLTAVGSYAYESALGAERPGRLSTVVSVRGTESYEYPTSGGFTAHNVDLSTTTHTSTSQGVVTSDVGAGQSLSIPAPSPGSCQPGAQCCFVPTVIEAADSFVSAGDGTAGATLTTSYEMSENTDQFFEPRIYRVSDSCAPASSCSPGTTQHEWACSTPSMPGHEVAVKDKRGNWTFNQVESPLSGVPQNLLETKAIRRGASDSTGADALEVTNFLYGYPYPSESQVVRAIERDSVADPAGTGKARTTYAEGQVRSVVRKGWTQKYNAGTSSWETVQEIVGTFYFTIQPCTGDFEPDPLKRVREVHGPCKLQIESDFDCSPSEPYPVTQYTYWPQTEPNNNRARLRKVSQYPQGGPSCSSPLEYELADYDVFGNATSITDPNGVVTTLAYDADHHVTSRTIAQHSTLYGYSNGLLASIQHPEGNTEMFGYAEGLMIWKVKGDQYVWSEKAEYDYWPDHTLKEERYLTASGEVRRRVQHASDAHRRPTWSALGNAAVAGTRAYDRADNLAGVGLPFNSPPAWCGGVTSGSQYDLPISRLCAWLGYDRADRLESLVQHPDPANTAKDATTCVGYDAQSNINKIISGCETADSCSTILANPSHACQAMAATYQWDDFGNLINVTLPQTGPSPGVAGTTKYAYDVRGNVTRKQTPQMLVDGDATERTYDLMSRPLLTNHRLPNGSTELLYRFSYDTSEAPDPSCTTPTNTKGRLLRRVDSFGSTWYHYDGEGRVTREMRTRVSGGGEGGSCGSYQPWWNPDTLYAYTPNGNIDYIVYPYGRKITYVYGGGAYQDRVVQVLSGIVNEGLNSFLLMNVSWEPYLDALRSYDTAGSSGLRHVEYFLGEAAQAPADPCPGAPPSGNDETGRLRALWVSSAYGSGDVFKRTYTWTADQVGRVDTCLLGSTTGRTESFSYDALTRLTQAQRPAGNFTATGGAYDARSYGYDGRGRRTSESDDGCGQTLTYDAVRQDRLSSMVSSCNPRELAFQHDRDGRATTISAATGSMGSSRWNLVFDYGGAQGGSEATFKAVGGGGQWLTFANYFYDALGRRRLKQDPMGTEQEFFYDLGHQMLVDAYKPGMGSYQGSPIIDEYVWLGGRPVAIIRNRLDSNFNHQVDQSGDCRMSWAEGEAACGTYFSVTDHIGKPVLMLDFNGRIAGAADYDPFGRPNHVTFNGPQAASYANNLSNQLQWEMRQPPEPMMSVKMRLQFQLKDMSQAGDDYAEVKDIDTGQVLASTSMWTLATPWLATQAGHIGLFMSSDAANCCPTQGGWPDCGCPQAPNYPFKGIVPEAYEYQRFQTGATPFWTPLGFPGQYHDWDTGLEENWNRYYFAPSGYLQPEPVLTNTVWHVLAALVGKSLPTYAYAHNNPLTYVDPTGEYITVINSGIQVSSVASRADLGGKSGQSQMTGLWKITNACHECKDECDPKTKKKKKKKKYCFDAEVTHGTSIRMVRGEEAGQSLGDAPGFTVREHEEGHASDYGAGMTETVINPAIKSDGFDSMQECQAAQARFADHIKAYTDFVSTQSNDKRDWYDRAR